MRNRYAYKSIQDTAFVGGNHIFDINEGILPTSLFK